MDKVPTIAPSEFSPNSLEDSWMEPTRIEKSFENSTPALSVDVMVMAIEGSVTYSTVLPAFNLREPSIISNLSSLMA